MDKCLARESHRIHTLVKVRYSSVHVGYDFPGLRSPLTQKEFAFRRLGKLQNSLFPQFSMPAYNKSFLALSANSVNQPYRLLSNTNHATLFKDNRWTPQDTSQVLTTLNRPFPSPLTALVSTRPACIPNWATTSSSLILLTCLPTTNHFP